MEKRASRVAVPKAGLVGAGRASLAVPGSSRGPSGGRAASHDAPASKLSSPRPATSNGAGGRPTSRGAPVVRSRTKEGQEGHDASKPATAPAGAPRPRASARVSGKKSVVAAALPSSAPAPVSKDNEAQREEFASMQQQLFRISDLNHGGSIEFFEFLNLHRELARRADEAVGGGDGAMASMSNQELEKLFRQNDADHNMCLDYEEWQRYTEGILSVVGFRAFKKVCDSMLADEAVRKEDIKGKFDPINSDRLLEKMRCATTLLGQTGLDTMALLQKSANPNFVDHEGNFALLFAAEKGNADLVKALLRAGADVMRHNNAMDCAAFSGARSRNLPVLRLLLLPEPAEVPKPPPDDPLDLLRVPRHGEPVADPQELIEETTRLSRALVSGMSKFSEKEVRDLLQQRASVNFRDESGWTALTAAVFWGRNDCVEVMLRAQQHAGCSLKRPLVNLQNSKGRSCLHVAARKGRVELVPLLLGARGDPDLQDNDGWTPLHHAAYNGMDDVVVELVRGCADLMIRGKLGLTPWMASSLPSHAAQLREATLKLIEPHENINVAKKMIPILNDKELSPYQKLEQVLSLPGVNFITKNLRLYEQFFQVRTGPNKVRLGKVWEHLAVDFIKRLRSGETETPTPGPHLSEAENKERNDEHERKVHEQKAFIKQWFADTTGPPPSQDWQWDSREPYRENLEHLVEEEMEGFQRELDSLYENLKTEPFGDVLATKMPVDEVLKDEYLSQSGAHPILNWLDTLDVAGAVEALRCVQAAGLGKHDDESIATFMDLCCQDERFSTGASFWTSCYKLWLTSFAQVGQQDFQHKVRHIVDAFNEKYEERGMVAAHRIASPKTFSRLSKREEDFGVPDCTTYAGRTVASHVVDMLRASVTVASPAAACCLVDEFFRPCNLIENKFLLVRARNNFHRDAVTAHGYRDIVLNVFWDGGERVSPCGRQGKSLKMCIVGEVQIVIEDFLKVKKRMHLLTKFLNGDYDFNRRKDVVEAKEDVHSDGEPDLSSGA